MLTFQALLLSSCTALLGPEVSHEKKLDMLESTVGVKLPSDNTQVPVIDGVYSLLAFFGKLASCKQLQRSFSDPVTQAGVQSTCLFT